MGIGLSQNFMQRLAALLLILLKNQFMRKHIFFLSLLTLGAGAVQAQSLSIGAALPTADVSLKGTDGKTYTLEGAKTKNGLIVIFSCNTCPFVIKSQQRTQEVIAMAKEKGLGMVIINSNEAQRDGADSWEAMQEYAQKQGYSVPYVVDEGKVADAFGATRTPEVFLFDASGKLVYKGAMEDNPADPSASEQLYLSNAVSNMLAGKKIDPESTKSIGCTIKRKG
jgi:peroxiredoxin